MTVLLKIMKLAAFVTIGQAVSVHSRNERPLFRRTANLEDSQRDEDKDNRLARRHLLTSQFLCFVTLRDQTQPVELPLDATVGTLKRQIGLQFEIPELFLPFVMLSSADATLGNDDAQIADSGLSQEAVVDVVVDVNWKELALKHGIFHWNFSGTFKSHLSWVATDSGLTDREKEKKKDEINIILHAFPGEIDVECICTAVRYNVEDRLLIHAIKEASDINSVGERGSTPLIVALLSENLRAVELLLQNGANPNVPSRNGHTPLRTAIIHGAAFVRLLLDNGANPNTPVDSSGATPLAFAPPASESNKFIRQALESNAEKSKQ